jgi:DNA/RNA-binding domain of Phe-tRNA-synthetase-like protein
MSLFTVSDQWRHTYPGAIAGILSMIDAANGPAHGEFAATKKALEKELRSRWEDRQALKNDPVIIAYQDYYKRFKKTYHILLQVESVAIRGREIPQVGVLVEAMFMAELKNRILTAGHDASYLAWPIRVELATGQETLHGLGGQVSHLKPNDMYMTDGQGVLSAVIYGAQERSRIRPSTNKVIYTVYAPPGVSAQAVDEHLSDIQSFVKLAAPGARREFCQIERA